jgi:hypothetical protein
MTAAAAQGEKSKALTNHRQPAELHIDVRAGGELLDVGSPLGKHLIALVGADPERAAEVVQHDLHTGAFTRHLGQGPYLRVIDPRFEGQIVRRQPLEAVAKVRIIHEPRRRHIGRGADDCRIMCYDLADAAKSAASCCDLSFENRIDIWQPQIGKADNAGADLGLAAAPVAFLGNRPSEPRFRRSAAFPRDRWCDNPNRTG